MRYVTLIVVLFLFSCHQQTNDKRIISSCQKLKPLTKIKHAIQPGEWRESFTEIHEPLKSYISRNPTSASSQRNKLYIVKIGDFDEKGNDILEDTKLYLNAFYQIEVKELPSIKLDKIPQQYKRSNTYGLQLKTSYIIDTLLTRILPDSAFAVIAFTPYDLFPAEDWNFVFGMASREKRVGVWSIARLGDYNKDAQLFNRALMRTLKIATHETGHLFGISHCVINECCMNGGNSLSESDNQPLWFCWECTAKICWNRNILPLTQLQALRRFHQHITKDTLQIAYYNQAIALLDR